LERGSHLQKVSLRHCPSAPALGIGRCDPDHEGPWPDPAGDGWTGTNLRYRDRFEDPGHIREHHVRTENSCTDSGTCRGLQERSHTAPAHRPRRRDRDRTLDPVPAWHVAVLPGHAIGTRGEIDRDGKWIVTRQMVANLDGIVAREGGAT